MWGGVSEGERERERTVIFEIKNFRDSIGNDALHLSHLSASLSLSLSLSLPLSLSYLYGEIPRSKSKREEEERRERERRGYEDVSTPNAH